MTPQIDTAIAHGDDRTTGLAVTEWLADPGLDDDLQRVELSDPRTTIQNSVNSASRQAARLRFCAWLHEQVRTTPTGSARRRLLAQLLNADDSSRVTRRSLLAPRDLHLSLQQLALGAVMGACIGLFVSQPSAPNNAANLVGAVALSSSALSFVAGFGVERVFSALEMVICGLCEDGETKSVGGGLEVDIGEFRLRFE